MSGDEIRDRDALLLAFVGQHRAAHAISDRPYAVHTRAALVIDLDEAALIELHARTGGKQFARERAPPDRDNKLVER